VLSEQLHSAQQHLNMKYIILNSDELLDEKDTLASKDLIAGSDNTVLVSYETVPAKYSSKTTYTRSQVETMMRDSSNTYYLQGF
jgi:hypothetical protein